MRYYGNIGYGVTVEKPVGSGIWVDDIIEREYYGDVVRNTRQAPPGENLNNGLTVRNSISVVADDYIVEHLVMIKYITFSGLRWTVSDVDIQRPRLILSLGDPYNGPLPD